MTGSRLVLASQSPARLATLRSAGVDPLVSESGGDEHQLGPLTPAELRPQLAALKCASGCAPEGLHNDALVVCV